MAFKDVAVPWLSGGLIVLGYAAFSWRRATRKGQQRPERRALSRPDAVEPFATCLEHVSNEGVLELEPEQLPANNNGPSRATELAALFLGRASETLSPFHFGPRWPEVRR